MLIACPGCAARLDVPDDKAGNPRKKVMCPACQRIFRMEEAAAVATTGSMPSPRLPTSVATAAPRVAAVPPYTSAPPVAAGEVPHDQLVELDGFGMGLEELAPPSDSGRWDVDRLDYKGTTVSLEEIRDLIKRGWLHRTDRIRPADDHAWSTVGEQPGLEQALALRQKAISQKLAQMARKSGHTCENHPKKKASHICLECARAFCSDCGNDCAGTLLCLDCDAKMAPVS